MNKPHKKPMFESETRREPAANAQGRHRSPTAPPLRVSVSSPSLPMDRLAQISEPLPQTPSPSTTLHIRKGLSLLLPYILAHPDITVSFEGARYALARFQYHSLIYAQALSPCRWLHSHNVWPQMWVTILTLCSLPFATGFSDKSVPPEREDTAPVTASALLLFLPLAILVTIVSYIVELCKTYELPAQAPVLPAPGQCSVEQTLSKAQRSLVLRSPAAAWLLLSVVVVILTGVFWRFAESPQGCITLNPDVAGLGVRVSLWVPATIVMLVAVLGHYHAEETGVKGIAATLLVAQIIYTWNLLMQELGPADKLVGSMILDCLTFLTPITFSMKECLAARQLIRIGYSVQVCSVVVLAKTMTTFHHTGLEQKWNISVESCSCFQAYWWGPFDSCVGPSKTFWMYLVCKAIATIHGAWLCFRYMDHYDSAEKLSCGDSSNAKVKTIEDTVYDSIPATAFTKYRESIAIAISSMVTIEVTLLGFDLPASKDISSWGQTGQILVALATTSCFTYGFYSMWKNKNVERRQKAIRQCSYGALTPALAIHKCDDWSTWVKSLRLIVKDQHPFRFSQLRVVDHCRIQYGSEGWKKITHDCRKFKDLTREGLGAMLLDEAKLGDLKTVNELIEDRASVHETDKDGNTALINAAENNHLTIVELLLQHGALISAQNRRGETALHAAAQAKPCNEELVRILLEAGSSITIQNDRSETALHCAFQAFKDDQESHHRLAVCKLLVSKASKAAVSIVGRSGNSSLGTGKSTLAIQDSSGNTPLHYAFLHLEGLVFTEAGYEVLRLWLEDSDDLTDIQNNKGMIFLHCAVKGITGFPDDRFMRTKNILAVFELLMRATGAAMSLRDNSGNTPLHAYLLNAFTWSEEWLGITKALVETGDFSIQNNEGRTALHCAMKMIDEMRSYHYRNAGANPLPLFELLLKKATQAVMSLRDNSGNTPLHAYLLNKHVWSEEWLGITKALVETGDFSAQNNKGETVLHCAMKMIHEMAEYELDNEWADTIPVFELLLKKATQAAMSLKDNSGNTPLHAYLWSTYTLSEGWLGITKALVETGDFSAQNNKGKTVLHCAVEVIAKMANESADTIPVLELLSGKATQAAMSLRDKSGNTPLHAYLLNKHTWSEERLGIMKALVETGDFSAQNNKGKTVLHCAVEVIAEMANEAADTIPVFELLSGKATQAAMSLRDNSGNTPLHAYLLNKHTWSEEWLGITKALLETGDFSAQNNKGKTALHCTVEVIAEMANESADTTPVFEPLSKKATQVAMSLRDNSGNTALHAYLLNKHTWSEEWLRIAKALVETGDFSVQNNEGKTALHCTVEVIAEMANESADTTPVFELLSKKATQVAMSLRDNSGNTPLHAYLLNKHTWSEEEWLGITEALVETGDFSVQNNEGKTGLHCAVEVIAEMANESADTIPVFELLPGKATQAAMSLRDKSGNTPLHAYLLNKHTWSEERLGIMKALVETGDFSAQNNEGETVLHCAMKMIDEMAEYELDNESVDTIPVFELLSGKATQAAMSLRDNSGNTPLHAYLLNMHTWSEEWLGITKALVETGDFSAQNKGETVLHCAMKMIDQMAEYELDNEWADTIPVFELLSGKATQAAMSLRDNSGNTPLHAYLLNKHTWSEEWLGITKALVETGDFSAHNNEGKTVLHCAISNIGKPVDGTLKSFLNVFRFLMGRVGATVVSIQDYLGNTPLHHAILKLGIHDINRCLCVVPLVLKKTIDLGKQNNDGMTVLEALLSVSATGHDERTILDVAIADLSNETLKLLFSRSDLKPVYEQENTLLHRYLSRHADLDEEVVKILLGISDYSIKNKHGQTALHTAMANRNCPKDVLKVLLGVTRDLTLVDALGDTFLHCYLRRSGDRDEEVVKLLLEAIDDLVENVLGLTLLDVAVRHADIECGVLKVLLERFELVNYFRVSGGSEITAVVHLTVRERDLKSTRSPMRVEVTKLKTSGVLCQSPKEVDRYYHGEVPVPPPHGNTCTTNTRDQKYLEESGIVTTITFSDKPNQPMLPSISAKSFETSVRALLAGTRLEDIPFAATTYLRSELDTMIDLLHCCDYRIVIKDECGRLLLHTFSPTPQTTAKIIGILLDNCIDINISDGNGQIIPQNAILSRSMELVNVLVNKNRNTSRRDIDDNTFSSDTNNREKKQIGFSASPDKIISIPNRRILQPTSLRRRLNRNSNNPISDQI